MSWKRDFPELKSDKSIIGKVGSKNLVVNNKYWECDELILTTINAILDIIGDSSVHTFQLIVVVV